MYIADISHYQGTIDWNKARKQLDLVIFRASIDSREDSKYASYIKECGVPFGAYHYVKAGNAIDAAAEAKFFYQTATKNGAQPLFFCADIEFETQTSSTTKAVTTAFANTLREQGAKRIGLYISQSRYKYAARELYDFIWIPRYGKNTGKADETYAPIYPCDLWQYTSMGHIDGINARVDLNKLYGDKDLSWFTGQTKEATIVEGKPFSNIHFANFCRAFVGQPYWYGTNLNRCTKALWQQKSKQFPEHYTSDRNEQYKRDILNYSFCADCVGLIIGYLWSNAGEGILESIGKETDLSTNKVGRNGMPSKSSNGLFEWAKQQGMKWGTIDTIPDVPGIAVRYDGHVGVYVGNGEVVEESGFKVGCILSQLKKKKWTHWYRIPGINYNDKITTESAPIIVDSIDTTKEVVVKRTMIAIEDLNVRAGNSPIYPTIKSIPKGEQVEVLLDENNNPIVAANNWYAIQCGDKVGWISGYLVKEKEVNVK